MLSVLQTAGDGSTLIALFLVLLVSPLGWIILFGIGAVLVWLVGAIFPSSPSTSSQGSSGSSSSSSTDRGDSDRYDYYPYHDKSEQINAEFAEQQAKRDRDWEELQTERDNGQYGIWRKRD